VDCGLKIVTHSYLQSEIYNLKFPSHSLQSLHVVHTRNLSHTLDDIFQVLQVFDLDHDVNVCLTVFGARANVADVGFRITNHGGDLLKHSKPVIAKNREFDRECGGRAFLFAPLDVNAPLRLVHQVEHVRAIHRMHGDALAASHIANDSFSANGIATARAINQQVAV